MGQSDPIPIGCSAIKPVERHGWEAFSWFMYDKETGAIMGRTPKSWALITIFYIIYYACLAGFWALMLVIFFQFIQVDQPKWQQDNSLIGRSPALGVRPKQLDSMIDSSMIAFNKDSETGSDSLDGWKTWADRSKAFLDEKYKKANENGLECTAPGQATDGKFCRFKVENIEKFCGPNFGFDRGHPCILLKLNKIYGLVPDFYNDTAALPESLPEGVRTRMASAPVKNQVWVDCKGENAADREGLGSVEYLPKEAGFSEIFFPYTNQAGYQSPIVAVKFSPTAQPGQLLHIECRAWAKNIGYNRRDRMGIAHMELVVHNKATAEAREEL